MNCHFCKGDMAVDDQLTIEDKYNDESTPICRTCMNQVNDFFLSGKLESLKIDGPKNKIGLINHHEFCEINDDNKISQVYKNIFVERFDIQQPQFSVNELSILGRINYDDNSPHRFTGYRFSLEGLVTDPNVFFRT